MAPFAVDPQWIQSLFQWCVFVLRETAKLLGISYEAINVWLFVFILPGSLISSVVLNFVLLGKVRRRGHWSDD